MSNVVAFATVHWGVISTCLAFVISEVMALRPGPYNGVLQSLLLLIKGTPPTPPTAGSMIAAQSMKLLPLVFVALSLSGCADALTTARKSVSAAATLGIAAGDIVETLDQSMESDIMIKVSKDHDTGAAIDAETAWHAKRDKLSQALKTYDAVVVAAGATAELAGAKSVDLPSLLGSLSGAYVSLKGALSAYGVALPGGL